MPDIELTSGKGLVIAAFLLAVVVLLVFSSTLGAVLLGALLVGLLLLTIYYVGVRIDRRARGMGSSSGGGRWRQ